MEDRTVSLNAVIDVMHEMWGDSGELLDAIKELPPVTPKKGHWIWQTEDKYRCSCCGEVIRVKEVMNKPQYITCPMCDAKMGVE